MSRSDANVLIAQSFDQERLSALRREFPGCTFDVIPPFPPQTTLPASLIADRTVFVGGFPPANLADMRRLTWIQLTSAGYTQVAGLPLKSMTVRVSNASGVNDVPIAEWCILMMLSLARAFQTMLDRQRDRGWDRDERFQAELRGRRVGIIGYGNIGREVARLSRAHGLDVWALNRSPIGPTPLKFTPAGTGDPAGEIPHRCFTFDQIAEFLPHLDYLVLTAALNTRTRGILGARELRLLPPTAMVLNPARAHLIDEDAFQRALREGWIAGAALDSHYREPLPPTDHTWDLPNLIITPHISGSGGSTNYEARLGELLSRNLARFLNGQPLLNEVSWTDLNVE